MRVREARHRRAGHQPGSTRNSLYTGAQSSHVAEESFKPAARPVQLGKILGLLWIAEGAKLSGDERQVLGRAPLWREPQSSRAILDELLKRLKLLRRLRLRPGDRGVLPSRVSESGDRPPLLMKG